MFLLFLCTAEHVGVINVVLSFLMIYKLSMPATYWQQP